MRSELPVLQHICGAVAAYCRSLQPLQQAQCPLPPWHPQTVRLLQTLSSAREQFVSLNSLRDNPGAMRAVSVDSCVLPSFLTVLLLRYLLCFSPSVLVEALALARAKPQGEVTRDRKLEQVMSESRPGGRSSFCSHLPDNHILGVQAVRPS